MRKWRDNLNKESKDTQIGLGSKRKFEHRQMTPESLLLASTPYCPFLTLISVYSTAVSSFTS